MPLERRRLLIIEDDPDNRNVLVELLRVWRYEVEVAAGGRDGLVAAARLRPQVVIIDIGLPEIDGVAIARQLNLADPRPFLIALSGWTDKNTRERARTAGFDVYLSKPVDASALRKAIESGLRP